MRLVALVLLMFAFGTQAKSQATQFSNEEYGTAGGVSLRMDGRLPGGKGPFPVAILVHGGGWIRGDRTLNVEPLFQPLEKAGIAWFSISYRLSTDWSQFGVAAEDVRQAIRHIRRNADRYQVDADRIFLIGESAGAHLASLAALDHPEDVAGVVALYCPSDLEQLARTSSIVPAQIRATIEASPFASLLIAHLRSLSPIEYVSPKAPPFLLVHGTADAVVPYDQSLRMQRRIQAVGGDCKLVAIEGGGHGLRYWERSQQQAHYQREIIQWLLAKLEKS